MPESYTVYVSDSSYYSGKLEAYVRYKQLPHRRVEVNSELLQKVILPATGFMKVPCVQCPDGRWLKDTTPMIRWLDARHPQASIYPDDPATRFIALLVEDYADEWLWRPAMYYRWQFRDSRTLRRHRLGHELSAGTWHVAALLGWFMRWRQQLVFVRGDGVRAHNEAAVRALYARTLAQLSALLRTRPFLLGARPSIVDFGFFASMFRHFAIDPDPAKVMLDTAPEVYAWVARLWNARADRDGHGALESFEAREWDAVFAGIAGEYLPYLDRNAQAWAAGASRFDLALADARYPAMPVVRYRVACRTQLLAGYAALDEASRVRVRARLGASRIADWLDSAAPIDSGLDDEFVMPLQRRYTPPQGALGWLRKQFGTPWDMPRSAAPRPSKEAP